jgi:hypothetical protein
MHTGLNVARNRPTDAQRTITNANLPQNPVAGGSQWQSIVNTDIKPHNIVLGHARDDYYPSYKTPMMIDFGLAFNNNKYLTMASKKAPGIGAGYIQIGTNGFLPPV